MAVIPLPSVLRAASVSLSKITPAQLNRSLWTGRSKILLLPACEYWTARVLFKTLAKDREIRLARAFFAALRGQGNTFDLPVLPTPQIVPILNSTGFQNLQNMTITLVPGTTNTWSLKANAASGQAASLSSFTGDFALRWQLNGATASYDIGVMVAAPAVGASPDFAIAGDGANTYGYSFGAQNFSAEPFTLTEYHFITRRGSSIEYRKGVGTDPDKARLIYVYPNVIGTVKVFARLQVLNNELLVQGDFDLPQNPVAGVAAAGAGAVSMGPGAEPRIRPGHYITFTLPSGHRRLSELVNVSASQILFFEPRLPEPLTNGLPIDLKRPHMRARLSSPETAHEDSNGTVTFTADVEEAL